MKMPPIEILREGRSLLDPVMHRHGFSFKDGPAGRSSGGHYASGVYVNGNRRLEIHFRYSLGLVTYHFGQTSLDHESYMHALLGTTGGNKYQGFSEDPLDAFRGLAYNVESFSTAFLSGSSDAYSRGRTHAEKREQAQRFA